MGDFFSNLYGYRFDGEEFFTGLVLGIVLIVVVGRLTPVRDFILLGLSRITQSIGELFSSVARDQYHQEILERAQMMHAARAIFKLDEIAILPHLLAPPFPADPLRTEPLPEYSLAVLPNLPDWTYLSGIYHAPSITLGDALADGANLMITGPLGSGKTTALAYLAIHVVNKEPEAGVAKDLVPVLIHASDLEFGRRLDKDPLKAVLSAAQQAASSGLASRIPGYVRPIFRQGRALLLLDGLDELTADELASVAEWLRHLRTQFPEIRIVAAGPVKDYDMIAEAGLVPVAIAPWTLYDQHVFLTQWGQAWQQYVIPNLPKRRMDDLDPALITGWLAGAMRGLTPLELTLRVWASYAGDILGANVSETMNSFIARFLSLNERQPAETAGLSWIDERQGAVQERSLRRGTPVNDLVAAGILIRRTGNRVSFALPALGSYLAARAMMDSGLTESAVRPGWAPAETALSFFAALGGDVSKVLESYLQARDDPLETNLLTAAKWLREAPTKLTWRAKILRPLATIASSAERPYGLRLRAVHALAQSEDPSIAILFRRLLASESAIGRLLGALGLGGVRDEESIEKLLDTIYQDRNLHVRQAACLALAAMDTEPALEGLGKVLLDGDESVRLASAEALASQPGEGFNMLRDAIEVENLLTRRAAVFGLARVPEPWALEILELVQVDDDQWVVRGAAAEAVERRRNPPWEVNPRVEEIAELPWLVEFAAREGMAVGPGPQALEMIRRAITKGTEEEQIAALEAISASDANELAIELRKTFFSSEAHIRDAAYEALWRIKAAGVEILAAAPQATS